jgi:uncharacterized damage-inducible protein DinB
MKLVRLMLLLTLVVSVMGTLIAQDKPALPKGIRGDILMSAMDAEGKVTGLVNAIPQEKFTWRPAEGVRSVSELFLHIAGANYLFPSMTGGTKMPEGMDPKTYEQSTTDKAKILEIVKASFASYKENLMKLNDKDLDKMAKFFGRDMSYRAVYLISATHMHEHLGQAIAYARTNGVVPPWTEEQNARAKEQMKKMN